MSISRQITYGIVSGLLLLASARGAEKPNVLFIFADDQCYKTIGGWNNPEVKTPNLDRLRSHGVTFTHAYNMGSWSGAVCVASRTMLISGRKLWAARSWRVGTSPSWPELMKQAGYSTYFTGKWHVGSQQAPLKLFDNAKHIRGGMPRQTSQGYNRPKGPDDKTWQPWDPKFGGFWEGGKHWSEVVGDDGVEFLEDASKEDKPFFMYLAFNAPHDPRQSPREYVDMYPLGGIKTPESFLPEYPHKDAMGCGKGLRDEKLAPFPRTEYAVKVNRQEYYAIITHMDAQVGRILDALDKSGKADDTYIFFTADHGLAVGHHGLLGKQNLFDHSIRVPLFVAGPDIPKGKEIDGHVYLQDVMASAIELSGQAKPDHVYFKSLLPLIRGERKRNYDEVYGAYLGNQRMIRDDEFKLLLLPRQQKHLLFDMQNDPEEMTDLSGDPRYAGKLAEMKSRLAALDKSMAASAR
ncbi:MAG: sulfatase-like hydrolase/transferase [Kiritimatiellia bacterium]|nr:sulfatase-like hydrolase/transferase [Kiritimatiellia bacterium]